MQFMSLSVFILVICVLAGCSTIKRCSEGGDVSWEPKIRGDMVCFQIDDENGNPKNNGRFVQKNEDGIVVVRGFFKKGKRDGYWVQLDPVTGKDIKKIYYENGKEKDMPKPDTPQPDKEE